MISALVEFSRLEMAKKTAPPSVLASLGLVHKKKKEIGKTTSTNTGNSKVEQRIKMLHNLHQTQSSRELLSAARHGDLARVQYLLKFASDCDINFRSSASEDGVGKDATALHLAAFNDHGQVAQHIILSGANIQAATQAGATALHIAAKRQSVSVLTAILARANSPEFVLAKDSLGHTALSYVARLSATDKRRQECVRIFARFGFIIS